MNAKLTSDKHGNAILTVEVPLTESKPSRSGNSTIIATTRGQQLIGKVRGKATYLQLNVMQIDEADGGLHVEQEESTPTTRRAA
jgi:hypothetical protein